MDYNLLLFLDLMADKHVMERQTASELPDIRSYKISNVTGEDGPQLYQLNYKAGLSFY